MSEELMAVPATNIEQYQPQSMELSVDEIVRKIAKVREVAERIMKDSVHYGTIPGTNKPTLYKAGGEILGLTFKMAPRYEGERQPIDLGNGHREYVIRCDMHHKETGNFLGSGVGSCSTMESKYRFRPGPVVSTGKPVPTEYWNARKTDPNKALQLIGGKGFSTKKIDGNWEIVQAGEVTENPNIADVYNTVLKIAAKRAYIDATLKATAASEVYTQDMEDIAENAKVFNSPQSEESKPPIQQPQRKSEQEPNQQPIPADSGVISEAQRKRMYAIAKTAKYSDTQFKSMLDQCGYDSSTKVLKKHYETIIEFIEGTPIEQAESQFPAIGKWCKEN
jgi:hypothetical protein